MKIRRHAASVVGALILAAGFAAAPAAAAPAPADPDPAKLAAGAEQDPQTGKTRRYRVGQGQDVPAVLGVTNVGDAPVEGLVVHVRILDDLDSTKTYENCWYAVDNNLESAWCEFGATLAPGASLAATGVGIATKPDARAEDLSSIIFRWVSKEYADKRGGIQALADEWAGQGTKAFRGTGGPLALTTPSVPLGGLGGPLGFAGVELVTPPTGEPTVTPSAPTPTPDVSASPGVPGEGGGLLVTGAGTTAVAGLGGLLLLLGGGGYLVARRRRTRFVA